MTDDQPVPSNYQFLKFSEDENYFKKILLTLAPMDLVIFLINCVKRYSVEVLQLTDCSSYF